MASGVHVVSGECVLHARVFLCMCVCVCMCVVWRVYGDILPHHPRTTVGDFVNSTWPV